MWKATIMVYSFIEAFQLGNCVRRRSSKRTVRQSGAFCFNNWWGFGFLWSRLQHGRQWLIWTRSRMKIKVWPSCSHFLRENYSNRCITDHCWECVAGRRSKRSWNLCLRSPDWAKLWLSIWSKQETENSCVANRRLTPVFRFVGLKWKNMTLYVMTCTCLIFY